MMVIRGRKGGGRVKKVVAVLGGGGGGGGGGGFPHLPPIKITLGRGTRRGLYIYQHNKEKKP